MAQYKGNSHDAKRARQGARMQEEMKEAFEDKIRKMKEETDKLHNTELSSMFSMDDSLSHQKFAAAIVGLQTHEQYKSKAKMYLNHLPQQHNDTSTSSTASSSTDKNDDNEASSTLPNKPKTKRNLISFADDSDESEESESESDVLDLKAPKNGKKRRLEETEEASSIEQPPSSKKRKIIRKNPNVNTSFLPDPERDLMDAKLRSELEQEWYAQQQEIKSERLEITYSYWDGSGHRRTIEITKGITIGQFLELARKELCANFSELRGLDSASLMYIKDDLIIPHSYLFYDLIVTDAKGKSGHHMFKHQAQDKGEYLIDTDLGHAGKVITRSWYERNKHIFPASRWELYDPLTHSK
mmetsp:Transcript_47066/g.78127  ORF Transcript_47066/g.78127 Transcript_47066/m.78127 type:complete len:355 (-) Transcript_47066:101-1165(-)